MVPPAPPVAIVFDCDGVLLDSNALKTACFAEVLQASGFAPADIEAFVVFQQANFGLSRFRLFEALLTWPLATRPAVTQAMLLDQYSLAVRGRYALCAPTLGMHAVVADLARRMPLFVVSGSAEAELREVLAERQEAGFFRAIYGSPATKQENLRLVLAALETHHAGLDRKTVLFIGDAEADFRAAADAGLTFLYMDRYSAAQGRMRALASEHGFARLDTLLDLPPLIGLPSPEES